MNLGGIDLNLMVVFNAIYTERNLTRAGEQVGLSQPAMSNALRRLRELFNDPLFSRTSEGMIPSPYAEQIAVPIRDALALLQTSLQGHTIFDPSKAANTFRIAMSAYSAIVIMPVLMEWLQKEAPLIRLTVSHIELSQAHALLKEGRLDLAITWKLNGAGLYQQRLFEERYVCLVRKDHPRIENILSLEQYLEEGHILFSLEGKGPAESDKTLSSKGLRRNVVLRTSHISAVPKILEHTNYILTVPVRLSQIAAESGKLKSLEPPLEIPAHSFNQFWHEKQHHDPANKWLRQVLLQLTY